jgi:uncharacterized membrane protein YdfJ with MMPL/SSD domain
MMLAILFGLSMNYQVFLVSRMHEERRAVDGRGVAPNAAVAMARL